MSDTRLIERWLPIAELGEESVRERRSMTALPPTYYLHVWWARRPLVASRAAILASLLPADADRRKFLNMLGIRGDPIKAKLRIDAAKRTGEDLGANPYGYERAFKYLPSDQERTWFKDEMKRAGIVEAQVLDPTAGGGSIPFEAARLGLNTLANDLNPVAATLLHATVEYPIEFGKEVLEEFQRLKKEFLRLAEPKFKEVFPEEPADTQVLGYLWARTIRCPYCDGLVPLSPNWRLTSDGDGIRLRPNSETDPAKRRCEFEVVSTLAEQSSATIADGDATCPFPDCQRVISGDVVKNQAQTGLMGEQLYAVIFKQKQPSAKGGLKWQRSCRAARASDDNLSDISASVTAKMPEWEALDCVPNEAISDPTNYERGHRMYGMNRWKDFFNPRQLLCHVLNVETFNQLLDEERRNADLGAQTRAAFVYLATALDKLVDYSSRQVSWHPGREVLAHTFSQHSFAVKWSYAEMTPAITGGGLKWVFQQTEKCLRELIELARPQDKQSAEVSELDFSSIKWTPSVVTISCKSGDTLDHIPDNSISCIVMDPPYYDNVMYAELSDFFYVWLKRTAGKVLPELFRRQYTDKENEAVANAAKFRGEKGAKARAGRDYQERMAAIFTECRRVLKPDGIMTLMFTHKATGAWDALTKGLMHAGFTITASWPINTEAEGSLHIKDKAAANSTIFLACRPRAVLPSEAETQYWEDVEPLVAGAVRRRVAEFQTAGIRGVDLYLACFGPALEEFSKHWPLKRGTPNPLPPSLKRTQKDLFPEEWDPYAVSPEDALNAARREVKSWRLEQLTHKRARTELDPRTSWFVLAWDAFQAPVFPYDEALRLARAVGVDLDKDIAGSLAEKKGSDLTMWDSAQRAAKSALGSADGSSGMIDALHHAAHQCRTRTLEAGKELLERAGVVGDAAFPPSLLAILEVLPVGTAFSGVELPTDVAGAGSDFEALEKLRRLAFSQQVEAPQQLELWSQTAGR